MGFAERLKMYRESINKLKEWKLDANKKPLVFLGARQVGKTWLIQEFGKTEYRQLLYINFERADELRNTFLPDLNPKRFLKTRTQRNFAANKYGLGQHSVSTCKRK